MGKKKSKSADPTKEHPVGPAGTWDEPSDTSKLRRKDYEAELARLQASSSPCRSG